MIDDIPKFLDVLCIRLGLCLSPEGRAEIARARFRDSDAFEEALLRAEGLDPLRVEQRLRDNLRELINRHWSQGV